MNQTNPTPSAQSAPVGADGTEFMWSVVRALPIGPVFFGAASIAGEPVEEEVGILGASGQEIQRVEVPREIKKE